MNQMINTGKTDTRVFLDNTALGGVVYVSVQENNKRIPVYEMLSESPWCFRDRKNEYLITIKQLSDKRYEYPGNFNVTIESDKDAYLYTNCVVESSESYYDESRRVVTVTKIVSHHKELIE